MLPTIPKTIEDQILKLLPEEIVTSLLEIQREEGREFNETLYRMAKLYTEVYELNKLYNFKMISKHDENDTQVIDDWEL